MRKPENLGSVRKVDPCFTDFLVKNGTHVQGFLVKKRPIRVAHPRSAKYVSTPGLLHLGEMKQSLAVKYMSHFTMLYDLSYTTGMNPEETNCIYMLLFGTDVFVQTP